MHSAQQAYSTILGVSSGFRKDPEDGFESFSKDRELNNLKDCLAAMRFALPHPLTPSPRAGEGGQDSYSPLPLWERGWG